MHENLDIERDRPMNLTEMNEALVRLCAKYAVPSDGRLVAPPAGMPVPAALQRTGGPATPLLPWRVERRFVELKKMIDDHTLEEVSTLRFFACLPEENLAAVLLRELDLCEFFSGSRLRSAFAVGGGTRCCNVVAVLDNGWNCSLECVADPGGRLKRLDRHEIIARRGVASDRVVDTQLPQASIYVFTAGGERCFTDCDLELFGFDETAIWPLRAAFAVLSRPALAGEWEAAADRLARQVSRILAGAAAGESTVFTERMEG